MDKKLKIYWNEDPVVDELLPLYFKGETVLIKDLFFVYDKHYINDKENPCLSGLELALKISASPGNFVIFCSSCDSSFFIRSSTNSVKLQFLELVNRENVTFLQIPLIKEKVLDAYRKLTEASVLKN